MRSSWNFSTAIFEIWVLVLTKPGWANETPTTSLRVPREYNDHHHQLEHHHPHDHNHHNNHHYNVAGSTSSNFDSSSSSSSSSLIRNTNHHHHPHHLHHQHPHSSSSYYNSGSYNNNNHYYSSSSSSSHHNGNNNHHHLFDSDSAVAAAALASSSLLSMYSSAPHRCYVCLPPNKNSKEAQQILAIFANELRPLIPDCSQFDPYVDTARFEFDCPPKYGGCLLRIHGSNISRACSKYRVNDCKKANTVEFCYCTTPLCNDKKPEPPVIPAVIHHHQGNSGNGGRSRGGSRTSKSSSAAVRDGGSSSSPQGIRTRVSEDDEDTLNPPDGENDDDDDDNGGSGTGSSEENGDQEQQQSHHRHLNTIIDPFLRTTMDPTIFQEESSFAVAVDDPNPHTKIGISMTASTSSGGSSISSNAILLGGSFFWWWPSTSPPPPSCWWPLSSSSSNCNSPYSSSRSRSSSHGPLNRVSSNSGNSSNIFNWFLYLHRLVFIRLFDAGGSSTAVKQVVVFEEDHKQQLEPSSSTSPLGGADIDKRSSSIICAMQCGGKSHQNYLLCEGGNQVVRRDEQEVEEQNEKWRRNLDENSTSHSSTPEPLATLFSSPLCVLNSQLCFIISLLLVLKVLSS